ncbi:hypothetical protein QFZ62_000701 [Clavibacter sp. B3I6]|uniref:hypothetical protein n=1 Tax=Clavibacter sp. B3I6 TaxID=3042268 RepID=UPI002780F242|nr:hypothetical protein [Clavibacter sp. B3I6]MDQ0743393.1 hypothetical protein [Clavibacter sp. B3I6]
MTALDSPAAAVAAAAAEYDDGEGLLTAAALERLAAWQATAGKACLLCERTLPASAYGADGRAADGLETRCRECLAQRRREQRRAVAS